MGIRQTRQDDEDDSALQISVDGEPLDEVLEGDGDGGDGEPDADGEGGDEDPNWDIGLDEFLGDDADDEEGDPDGDDPGAAVALNDDQVGYEFNEWAGESRGLLDSFLTTAAIPHAWHGTTLVVRVEDEGEVDDLVDEVQAMAQPALDAEPEKVVFEVGEWPAALQAGLAESLGVASIPYEWDANGDLVVYASDEDQVDSILESMPDPEDAEVGLEDGAAVQDSLSDLFVAAERLARVPSDAASVIAAVQATSRLERMSLPFGFQAPVWRALMRSAGRLRDLLESEDREELELDDTAELDEDEEHPDPVAVLAAKLRDRLRAFT